MKYAPEIYAKALVEASLEKKAGESTLIRNFLALVRNNHDEARLPKIVEAAEKMMREKTGVRKVTVESARPIKNMHLGRFIKKSDVVEEKIDPGLIAGLRITLDDHLQFDGTLAHKLDQLFK